MSKSINFYNRYHKKNGKYFSVISDNNFTYYNHLKALKIPLSNVSPIRVLDVGCGVGTLAFYMANKGNQVHAIDLSPDAIKIAEEFKAFSGMTNVNFQAIEISALPADLRFDLVTCTEVIEHIPDEKEFAKRLASSTSSGGYLLLSTPSVNAPLFRLGLLDNFDKEVGHLRRYSIDSISNLLEESGFTIVSAWKTESIIRNVLFTYKAFGILIRFIRGPLIPLFHALDNKLAKLLGESDILILARKN